MTTKLLAILSTLLVGGCYRDTMLPYEPELSSQSFLSVSPSDGESSVRLDVPITLFFAKPVEQAFVERGFHLIGERAMADSLCPISSTMDHGNIMSTMADTSMMRHLDQYHLTPGRFAWNSDSSRCTFKPDSKLSTRTLYMIHLNREITKMMEQRMGSMGTMTGHGTGMMSSDMIFHFFTLDTSRSGSGQSSHH